MPLQIMGFSEEADIFAQSSPQSARQPVSEKQYRTVVCFDCQHIHKVSGMSTSSLCPNCGSYIDLRDVVIKDRTTQKIRTRGDVLVEKKGALLGTSITCGNLTVEGQIAGSIYASGTVIFKGSGKVLGEVRCQHLQVEKKCELQFLQPVHATTAQIFGETTGNYHIAERMFINRRGSVFGSVKATTMLVEAGAKLNCRIEVRSKPIPAKPEFTKHQNKSFPFFPPAPLESVLLPPPPTPLKESQLPPAAAMSAESLALWADEDVASPS